VNYFKFKNKNIACFNKVELEFFYQKTLLLEILKEMRKRNVSFDDLKNDIQKMLDISDVASKRTSKNKEEHEIFSAFYIFLNFYKKDSQVCFELKNNFDTKKSINGLTDLRKAAEESTLNDFIIKSRSELRLFQLKRYRDEVNAEKVIRFIKKVLAHYGNNLGETNLLVMLESPKWYSVIKDGFFEKINIELNNLNLKSESQILIAYNEDNKYSVIIQVYPKLTRSQIPLKINYRSLLSEHEKRQK